jgi:hypothetical protein
MRRLVMLSVLVVAVAGALVVAPNQTKPAEAKVGIGTMYKALEATANGPLGQYATQWSIDIRLACRQQYHGGSDEPWFWDRTNPYSWGCYRPLNWYHSRYQYLGGVNLDRYCRWNHGLDTHAKVTEPRLGVYGWSCRKNLA